MKKIFLFSSLFVFSLLHAEMQTVPPENVVYQSYLSSPQPKLLYQDGAFFVKTETSVIEIKEPLSGLEELLIPDNAVANYLVKKKKLRLIHTPKDTYLLGPAEGQNFYEHEEKTSVLGTIHVVGAIACTTALLAFLIYLVSKQANNKNHVDTMKYSPVPIRQSDFFRAMEVSDHIMRRSLQVSTEAMLKAASHPSYSPSIDISKLAM